ncbi:MAG: ROK family protein [Clostridiales bacterium]|jgi:glucokinase|nr:ROK family protein [Clostridiales bacterium]
MHYIGIDLGGTYIKLGIVDEFGKIKRENTIETKRKRHFSEIIKDILVCLTHESFVGDLKHESIGWIGIGTTGVVDNQRGIVSYSCNVMFDNFPIKEEIQKCINKPVFFENDANCAAFGEFICGGAQNTGSSVTITLGTGIGGGMIINGKIYSGLNGAALEIGHMIINPGGRLCTCGRRGCWETYSSATGLIRITKDKLEKNKNSLVWNMCNKNLENMDAAMIFEAAKLHDDIAQKIVELYIRYLGDGITNIVNIFQPEKLIISGGISKQGEYLLKPLKKYVDENKYTRSCDVRQTELSISCLREKAAIVGAAFLGKQN